jgi:hypothetical protein
MLALKSRPHEQLANGLLPVDESLTAKPGEGRAR